MGRDLAQPVDLGGEAVEQAAAIHADSQSQPGRDDRHNFPETGIAKPRTGFFLRAESFYNVATEIERLGAAEWYGGRSLHERSHGESFLDLAVHRFGPRGLYLLDEPEAALSVHGCLAMLARIRELAMAGSQFVVATHSPILLAVPGATIVQIDDGAIAEVGYDEAQPVALTRSFLADPDRYLHHLFADED
jgi:predicted ATPase